MSRVVRTCQVSADQAGRADRLVQALTGLSRGGVRGLFDHGCVTVNGRPAPQAGEPVGAGDLVEVRYDPHTHYREVPRPRADPAFRVLFVDDQIIVVDKAAFALTVPTEHQESNTLAQRVARYVARGGPVRRVHVVQRLDRGTSGILVFAITRAAALELQGQFRRHDIVREYVALVAGTLGEDRGTFESRLTTNRGLSRYSTSINEAGERAVTHFEVEARLPGATRVRIRLETGRRNQIRVHFSEAGHPVLGDPRYSPERARHPRWRRKRLALHAAVLAFRHPTTGQILRFESPPPVEFAAFLVRGESRLRAPKR